MIILYCLHTSVNVECPVEGSYWTGNEDEFLKKLSNLTFKGTETSSNLFTVEALAEALVVSVFLPQSY